MTPPRTYSNNGAFHFMHVDANVATDTLVSLPGLTLEAGFGVGARDGVASLEGALEGVPNRCDAWLLPRTPFRAGLSALVWSRARPGATVDGGIMLTGTDCGCVRAAEEAEAAAFGCWRICSSICANDGSVEGAVVL